MTGTALCLTTRMVFSTCLKTFLTKSFRAPERLWMTDSFRRGRTMPWLHLRGLTERSSLSVTTRCPAKTWKTARSAKRDGKSVVQGQKGAGSVDHGGDESI